MHALETVTLLLVMRQVVLLVILEIRHVALLEDSSIAVPRLAMLVMLLVPLVVDQKSTTVWNVLLLVI